MGRLPLSLPYRQWMEKAIADLGLELLPITLDHAERQALLPWHHRDPFDRMIVAQAQVEIVSVVSNDAILDRYGINRLW
jgi:PIN domain nuclease of toxin-antitoxin system